MDVRDNNIGPMAVPSPFLLHVRTAALFHFLFLFIFNSSLSFLFLFCIFSFSYYVLFNQVGTRFIHIVLH